MLTGWRLLPVHTMIFNKSMFGLFMTLTQSIKNFPDILPDFALERGRSNYRIEKLTYRPPCCATPARTNYILHY